MELKAGELANAMDHWHNPHTGRAVAEPSMEKYLTGNTAALNTWGTRAEDKSLLGP